MGVFDSLFGSNTTNTTQTQTLAGPAAGLATDLFNRVQAYANQPYDYLGTQPRDAGFVADQNLAFGNTRNIASQSGNLYNMLSSNVLGDMAGRPTAAVADLASRIAGYSSPDSLGTTFDRANIAGYMNPYTDAVLKPAIEDIQRRSDQERNRLQGVAARTGSFGGSRNALAAAELERNTENEIGRLSANERARAYNEGANQFRLDQQRLPELAAQGIQGYNALAGYQNQGYNLLNNLLSSNAARLGTEVNAPLATGGLQQAFDQQVYDRMLQDRIEQRDWAARGINALQSALGLGGAVTGARTESAATGPEANRFGQVLGATSGIVGSLGGLSGIANLAGSAWNGLSSLFGGGGSGLSGFSSSDPGISGGLASITGDFGSWF
jgi:hypothetical protein